MYGDPILCSSIVDADGHANILRMHWQNAVKPCGKRKSRLCIDGSHCAAPPLDALLCSDVHHVSSSLA
jgi:hypothetical protein